jgi:hypothetical protein
MHLYITLVVFGGLKSSHVRNTGLIKDRGYSGPEFYITSNPNGKYACLWNSNYLNHYINEYPCYLYMDKS